MLERALYYVTLKYCLDTTYLLTGFTMKAKGITIVVSNNDVDCAFTITGVDIVEALISGGCRCKRFSIIKVRHSVTVVTYLI